MEVQTSKSLCGRCYGRVVWVKVNDNSPPEYRKRTPKPCQECIKREREVFNERN